MPTLAEILTKTTLPSIESTIFSAREAVYAAVPADLHNNLRSELENRFQNGLYSHQAAAINAALQGNNVCLATSTASGKSLVFQAFACHIALSDPNALTIAIYPARALVQDQFEKWKSLTAAFDIRVGQIDGSVKVKERKGILDSSSIVVMTPDVVHSWLLRTAADNLANLQRLRLVVIDEAHVYNGVFGTNAAYLFRRLSVLAGPHQVIASTATIGEPVEFLTNLMGRSFSLFTKADEGSPVPEKRVTLSDISGKKPFGRIADLLHLLVKNYNGRFLVFADSRKVVETLTRATLRLAVAGRELVDGANDDAEDELEPIAEIPGSIMPYRSGYEAEDRAKIQSALAEGLLQGVISTSALELGLDIGDIDLVVMVDTPPSIQAFWQRFGRAGRGGISGECLVIDSTGTVSSTPGGLQGYLALTPEPNYLYLENEVMQFTNAMAAAYELRAVAADESVWDQFPELPVNFRAMLSNEINPVSMVPDELFNLKQRAENGLHIEFPLRASGEVNFKVLELNTEYSLGDLSHAQMVREAYPGAIYLYQARPYRIRQTNLKDRELKGKLEFGCSTQPVIQVMVFPNFATARLRQTSTTGFLIQCDVQVSEQVTGFQETRGAATVAVTYGPGSLWWQKPVNRFLRTTGVLWHFDDLDKLSSEAVQYLIDAFTRGHAIHRRDIGFGNFQSSNSPLGDVPCKGICIYDDVPGGLRLTERLAHDFPGVLASAIDAASHAGDATSVKQLENCLDKVNMLSEAPANQVLYSDAANGVDGWIELISRNQPAIFEDEGNSREVEVLRYFYGPTGLQYVLKHADPGIVWKVLPSRVTAIFGRTQKVRYNPETGEEVPI